MFSIKDRAVIITGAAQGIGRQFALSFAEAGAKIVCADINIEKIENVVQEVKDAGGIAIPCQVDVTKPEQCDAMAALCKDEFGRIDIIINSAAIFSTIQVKPIWEMPKEEWDALIEVNLTGVFNCCKAVLPTMMEQEWGRVINLTSSSFFEGRGNYVHYVASKAGIIGLTRSMANDVGKFNITCNCISPGATITEIRRGTIDQKWIDMILSKRDLKRMEVPEDLVGVAIFMASEAASFMTGQTIIVDGGMVFLP